MLTDDDAELALSALACIPEGERARKVKVLKLLRDECGWSLRQADNILRLVAPRLYDQKS